MNIVRINIIAVVIAVLLSGCSPLEISRTVWGSSTRALEEARVNGIIKTYDATVERCYEEALKAAQEAEYEVFIQDKSRAVIVVMGIKGSVNTTEVGVFFVEVNDRQTRIEISSLSTNAKRIVAKGLLHGLDVAFGLAAPDAPKAAPADEQTGPAP